MANDKAFWKAVDSQVGALKEEVMAIKDAEDFIDYITAKNGKVKRYDFFVFRSPQKKAQEPTDLLSLKTEK